jgi:hypothetical protein
MIAIESLVSLGILLGLMNLYNAYRVDRLRDDLFAVRDRLFDEARAGRISFDSPAYRSVRAMCNGLIRFGHTTSLSEFIAFKVLIPRTVAEEGHRAFAKIQDEWPAADRALVQKYIREANICVLRHLARSPFVKITVLPPLAFVLMTRMGVDIVALALRRLSKPLESLDSYAMREGKRTQTQTDQGSSAFA